MGGEVVASASGINGEKLRIDTFDVRKYRGKTARLRISDQVTDSWGHVFVDHIVLTDKSPIPEMPEIQERTFTVEKDYLVLPIDNECKYNVFDKGSQIHLYVDGKEVRRYNLRLAQNARLADWYAFFTIKDYKGKEARVSATTTKEGFGLIRQTDAIPGAENYYKESHRPQFHFTQKVGWNNDTNGMVYHDGKWHLFFQLDPVTLHSWNKAWGHATSDDLLHWEQQPTKLFPGTMAKGQCFSGGAVVDKKNTAGWGGNALVASFTDTGCGEALAYSTDGGETFTYYEGNPVVKHRGRDPKIVWYEYDADDRPLNQQAEKLNGHWVMAVYDYDIDNKDSHYIAFYTSTNLKDWTRQSSLAVYHECPELVELPVDGDEDNTRWVVFAANAQYVVGAFDGRVFTPEHEGKHQVHWGYYYASQIFSNPPDGRKIQIGWVTIKSPGPYNQHFSFPHRLTLHSTDDGIRMFAKPIKEIEQLHAKTHQAEPRKLRADQPVDLAVNTDLLDVRLAVELGDAKEIELHLPGMTVRYNAHSKKLNDVPLDPVDGKIEVQVLLDRSIMEIAGNNGRVFITTRGPGNKVTAEKVAVVAKGGNARLIRFEAYEMESMWNTD